MKPKTCPGNRRDYQPPHAQKRPKKAKTRQKFSLNFLSCLVSLALKKRTGKRQDVFLSLEAVESHPKPPPGDEVITSWLLRKEAQ